MKGRDLVLVAVVLLVGGFAAADSLRGNGSPAPARETTETTVETREATPGNVVSGLAPGRLGGRLVYSSPETGCTVREIDLASGTVFPLPPLRSTCEIVSATRGERVAFTLASSRRNVMPYRVVDLNHPGVDLATFRALNGSVHWSPDGQMVAWCEPGERGRLLEIGRRQQPLPGCPATFTNDGRLAYVAGGLLREGGVEGRRFAGFGEIVAASYGTDGSLALAGAGERVAVWEPMSVPPLSLGPATGAPGRKRFAVNLPYAFRGRRILFSPTNCSAALLSGADARSPTVAVVALRPCASESTQLFPGHAAAWSPDGRWLAVAEDRTIAVHPVGTSGFAVRLRASAVDIAWKG